MEPRGELDMINYLRMPLLAALAGGLALAEPAAASTQGSLGTTSGEFFGLSVAISGNTALIGARYDSQNGGLAGAAYVFRETAPGTWTQIAKLLADDGASGDTF